MEMLHSGSLLAKRIPGTCVTASELPYSVESSRLQDGFIACCWYNSGDTRPARAAIQNHINRGYVRGDGQSNDDGAAAVPTAVYWKLQRILKLSNLNGSCAVTSLSPCPLSVPTASPCAQLKPFYPYIAPGLAVHAAQNRDFQQRCLSSLASVPGLCLSIHGLFIEE